MARPLSLRRLGARLVPHTMQARLTVGFAFVVALTLFLVSILVLNRLDDHFSTTVRVDLDGRALAVHDYVVAVVRDAAGDEPVVDAANRLNPAVAAAMARPGITEYLADRIAQADVQVRLGSVVPDASGGIRIEAAPEAVFGAPLSRAPEVGQARDPIGHEEAYADAGGPFLYGLQVTLANPLTFRASTIAAATGLLAAVGILAFGAAIIMAAVLAQRFTVPLRRLTDASRALAEGDLSRRVPTSLGATGSSEIVELSRQFNAMAAQLEESIATIRNDRDRSRDFLADVSHELRTPIAALRTFNELLLDRAGDDPQARAEFLESSGQQLERLDWLAQNLLELSKLDSGLVLLDLRPDDLRACVESAVEQAQPTARRRDIELTLRMPDSPLRVRHDPPRIGQVVANLVGNALKFTQPGGGVVVEVRSEPDGAAIVVSDTGVGIDAAELPRIFERFYRGVQVAEARGSGSGLGLAIVASIVDMHGGRVAVDSTLGAGSTFTVFLPRDPRAGGASEPATAEPDEPRSAEMRPAPSSPQA
jgi:signal transduction histidine kinase